MSLSASSAFPSLDSHQHFWRYSVEDYGWIDEPMARIRRDFLPKDLQPNLAAAGLSGCIAVQARQTLEESRWLVELARENSFIKGVVGWVPLAEPQVGKALESLQREASFKGVRHVVQGESDGFLDRDAFNAGIREITKCGLTYDVLVFARQLPEALRFIDRHSEQTFVLDHIAKPTVVGAPDPEWRRLIQEFAGRERTFCKFSGVVTEVPGWRWTPSLLRPYFEVVLEAFGPQRLMFGSDWPVCLVATEYAAWVEFVRSCTVALSSEEQSWIFGRTASTAYRL